MDTLVKKLIIIPTLNERENIKKLLPDIFRSLTGISVLVVDDSSQDGTAEVLSDFKRSFKNLFFVIRKNEPGYGHSSIEGFKWAMDNGYENIVTMDADFSHDYNSIPALIEGLKNTDVVIGSRYVRGGGIRNWHLLRRILSKFANFYVGLILGLPVSDATSGFNAYRASVLSKVNFGQINSEGYAFLVELKYRLFKNECRFIEHPIIFSERREGESKMSLKVIWESACLPWKIKS